MEEKEIETMDELDFQTTFNEDAIDVLCDEETIIENKEEVE